MIRVSDLKYPRVSDLKYPRVSDLKYPRVSDLNPDFSQKKARKSFFDV
jgi:hypothetical protein